jgi:hypothetical protein
MRQLNMLFMFHCILYYIQYIHGCELLEKCKVVNVISIFLVCDIGAHKERQFQIGLCLQKSVKNKRLLHLPFTYLFIVCLHADILSCINIDICVHICCTQIACIVELNGLFAQRIRSFIKSQSILLLACAI